VSGSIGGIHLFAAWSNPPGFRVGAGALVAKGATLHGVAAAVTNPRAASCREREKVRQSVGGSCPGAANSGTGKSGRREVERSGVNRNARPNRATGEGRQTKSGRASLTSGLQMSFQVRSGPVSPWAACVRVKARAQVASDGVGLVGAVRRFG
jgi:hypothetical protein